MEANCNLGSFPSYHFQGSWQVKICPVLLLSSLYEGILDATLPRSVWQEGGGVRAEGVRGARLPCALVPPPSRARRRPRGTPPVPPGAAAHAPNTRWVRRRLAAIGAHHVGLIGGSEGGGASPQVEPGRPDPPPSPLAAQQRRKDSRVGGGGTWRFYTF